MNVLSREMREVVREEPLMHAPIVAALVDGPLTVPEIAAAIGQPSGEVMVWVMGMRRYGLVTEVKEVTGDGYYRYATVQRDPR